MFCSTFPRTFCYSNIYFQPLTQLQTYIKVSKFTLNISMLLVNLFHRLSTKCTLLRQQCVTWATERASSL